MNNPVLDALTLDQLRLFVAVADEGSFSAAARKLGRAQSAVSYGLANLEQLLEVQLFDRSGRTPVLTDAGTALLPHARLTLEQAGRLTARAQVVAEGLEDHVRVAVDAVVPPGLLVEMGRGFHDHFPTVSLRLETNVLEAVPAMVLDGTCDLGIAGPAGSDAAALERRRIGEIAMVTVAAPGHPLADHAGPIPRELAADQIQIVITQRGSSDLVTSDEGVVARASWRVADTATKLALLRAGLGWGHMPLDLVADDLERGDLLQIELAELGREPLRVPLWAVAARGAALGPAAQWLFAELSEMRARCDRGHQH